MNNEKWLTHHEVINMTGRSCDYIAQKEKQGTFPKRFKIDKTHVRWNRDEIEEWVNRNLHHAFY